MVIEPDPIAMRISFSLSKKDAGLSFLTIFDRCFSIPLSVLRLVVFKTSIQAALERMDAYRDDG